MAAGVEGELKYLFIDDGLVMASYEFDAEDVSLNTLAAALDAKYGEHRESGFERFAEVMTALLNVEYGYELRPEASFMSWETESGTDIILTNGFSDDLDDIDIVYYDEALILALNGQSLSEPAPMLNPDNL